MIDISTVVLAVLAGLFYRWVVSKQMVNVPDKCQGPQDHSDMPEMKYIPAMEATEYNASKFLQLPGSGYQVGAFGETVKTQT